MHHSFYSVLVAVLALLSCLSSIPPLIVHIRAKNLATTVLILSFAIPNLQNFLNALIWPSADTQLWWNGKILCDIEAKLYLGAYVAVDGALACMFRHMANIFDPERLTVSITPSLRERRINLAIELFNCILAPAFVMGTHYLIQQKRYYIRPISGCTPSVDWSWLSVLLMSLWPLLLCLAATVYCAIATLRLWRHRKEMSDVLGGRRSGDIRLYALACVILVVYFPFTLVAFAGTLFRRMHKYSWGYIHPPGWADDIVYQVQGVQPSFDRWAQIVTGYIIFGFLGLGHDAKQMYRSWLVRLKSRLAKRSHGNEPTGRNISLSIHDGESALEHGSLTVVTDNAEAAGAKAVVQNNSPPTRPAG
ncbi:pheromone A receptor-domain-containing protein [Exophiala viscosa]|uniref:pheromone A receptor-domain-containing protein n=1 Tax=Exophiala viscosa TaxID=2486360 RepID=UPI00219EE983|nr:pheromone A receptor-domain-containing protein [Exophiala viscosa]